MKCNICNEEFNPENLAEVMLHEHDENINPSKGIGIKGKKVEPQKGYLVVGEDKVYVNPEKKPDIDDYISTPDIWSRKLAKWKKAHIEVTNVRISTDGIYHWEEFFGSYHRITNDQPCMHINGEIVELL